MKHLKKIVSSALAVVMASSCASAALMSVNAAASNDTLNSHYATNPNGGVGQKKTITIDGDISDWDSSMLIAQGAANDDPRVYRDSSMHEIAMDDYALYACWDDSNLYLMWEMTNVQDVVGGPDDTFPLSQGNIWIYDMPYFLAFDIDPTTGGNGTFTTGQTMWDSGITFETNVDVLYANSVNYWNGPFVYQANSDGKFDYGTAKNINSIASMKWGNGILSEEIYGIDDGYGKYNDRLVGDMCGDDANWVEFNSLGHDSDTYDMHWELSIPLSSLGVTSSYIEENGIGVCKISTFGTSGMDCLPYDISMNDNADQPYSKEPSGTNEKEDEDHITTAFARIGKLSGGQPSSTAPTTASTAPTTESTAPTTASTAPTTASTAPSTNPSVVPSPEPSSEPDDVKPSTSVPTTNPAPVEAGIYGDSNLDTIVSIDDVTALQMHIALLSNLSDLGLTLSDVNEDGIIDINDATLIQMYLAHYENHGIVGETYYVPGEPVEPESTEPETTEPTEPETTEPTEPESTEPESTEPESTEPESTEPESTEPESTEPESTEPETTRTIYFDNSATGWSEVYIYGWSFGLGDKFALMKDEGNNIWSYTFKGTLPTDGENGFLFVNKNEWSGHTQTVDLATQAGMNLYIPDPSNVNSEGKISGSWSTK